MCVPGVSLGITKFGPAPAKKAADAPKKEEKKKE